MKRLYFLLPLLCLLCQFSIAQTFSSNERKKETEAILNLVINSIPFDSVYTQKKVYFLANELLAENSPLELRREKCRAEILNEAKIKKVKNYVVLGDFTLDWNNPVSVRVQLSIMPENKLLNLRLEKENEKWVIKNHAIFEN